jgi:SAM-dependent methyltransferase
MNMIENEKSKLFRCLVCDQVTVEMFLELGQTPLANKFLNREQLAAPEPAFPLRVGFCHTCTHVQLTERVPPSLLFEDYLYVSGASDTLKAHLHDLSDVVVQRFGLDPSHLVMDIGCNDGTLLSGFQRHGVRVIGVDPAANLAALSQQTGIERYVGFFTSKAADDIVEKWGRATIITATNTFPHIPDLADFLQGIQTVLAPGGAFIIECHYLMDIVEQLAFDTIYHEHVSYWALKPLTTLFERHGLQVVRAERLPIHHGQLRVTVQRQGEGKPDGSVQETLIMEGQSKLDRFERWQGFNRSVLELRAQLHEALNSLVRAGKRVVGYGAPAKGNTLLSFLGIGPETLPYIVDRSALKQGRYTPGRHIPVVATERLVIDQPEYVLLLAWNFVEEILAQQAEYRNRGGKFIIPVPTVRILS